MYSQFSLSLVFVFHRVTVDPELANSEPLLRGENAGLDSWETVVTTFHWPIVRNLVSCVFLCKDALFNTYCWFIEPVAHNSAGTYAWMRLSLTNMFSPWGTSQPSCAWERQAALQHRAWGCFKWRNHQEKSTSRILLQSMRGKTRRQSDALSQLEKRMASTSNLPRTARVCEWPRESHEDCFGGYNKFWQAREIVNIASMVITCASHVVGIQSCMQTIRRTNRRRDRLGASPKSPSRTLV